MTKAVKPPLLADVEAVEAVRARYRPERIKVLFVGESAPCSGKFFYCGNRAMTRHMRRAVEKRRTGKRVSKIDEIYLSA